jgi:hypothetical protein
VTPATWEPVGTVALNPERDSVVEQVATAPNLSM